MSLLPSVDSMYCTAASLRNKHLSRMGLILITEMIQGLGVPVLVALDSMFVIFD
jgi:hypothetical protein